MILKYSNVVLWYSGGFFNVVVEFGFLIFNVIVDGYNVLDVILIWMELIFWM